MDLELEATEFQFCSLDEWMETEKKIGKFSKRSQTMIYFGFFEILKNYFLATIFVVTWYGYVVCKNHNLSNLQASQQRTVQYTFKISRILTDEKVGI